MIHWSLRFGEPVPTDPNTQSQSQQENVEKKKSDIYRKLLDYLAKLEQNKFGLSDRNTNPEYRYSTNELCQALGIDPTEENITLILEALALTDLDMKNKRRRPVENHLDNEGIGYNVYNTAVPSFQYLEYEAQGNISDIQFRIDPKYIEQVVDSAAGGELDEVEKTIPPNELTGSIIKPKK